MPDDFALPGYDHWKLASPEDYEVPEVSCEDCGGTTRCYCDELYERAKDREMEDQDERSNPRWER